VIYLFGNGIKMKILILFFLVVFFGCENNNLNNEPINNWWNETHSGDATYYNANGSGACSFDVTTDLNIGAMNAVDYENSKVCGSCVEITGPKRNLTIKIVDLCPECKKGDIDLSLEAFTQIANQEDGRVDITWKYVPCETNQKIKYHTKEGSNVWWVAFQIRNNSIPIEKMELFSNNEWIELERTDYNYFIRSLNPQISNEFKIKTTSVNGDEITDIFSNYSESIDYNTNNQF